MIHGLFIELGSYVQISFFYLLRRIYHNWQILFTKQIFNT